MKKNKTGKSLFELDAGDMSRSLGKDFGSLNIGGDIGSGSANNLYLRRFSEDELYEIMKKVGLVPHLAKKGFDDLLITVFTDDSQVNYLKVYDREKSPDHLLIDLRVSESKFIPDARFFEKESDVTTYDMIVIEWLSAQNPYAEDFSDDRPQLPGQTKPGLGVLKYCFDMMYETAREVTKDGFLDVPDHMHGAIMYEKKFRFFNPVHDAILKAILRDLKKYSLVDISWGMITGTVIENYKKEPQVYDPSEQVFAVSKRMQSYFKSSKYKSTYNKYYKRKSYRLDYDEMVKRRNEMLKNKSIMDL